MTFDRLLRCAIGFGFAVLIDGFLGQAVNAALLVPMLVPDVDHLAHALVLMAVGSAAAGAACQLIAGRDTLTPYAVVAAVLAGGLAWTHGAAADLKLFGPTFAFACAGATLLAAVGADRLRPYISA